MLLTFQQLERRWFAPNRIFLTFKTEITRRIAYLSSVSISVNLSWITSAALSNSVWLGVWSTSERECRNTLSPTCHVSVNNSDTCSVTKQTQLNFLSYSEWGFSPTYNLPLLPHCLFKSRYFCNETVCCSDENCLIQLWHSYSCMKGNTRCEMRTSTFRPWLKNVAVLKSLLKSPRRPTLGIVLAVSLF